MLWLRWLLPVGLFAASVVGCGLGLYDDTGGAAPGTWWTFVCPDGGDVDAGGGCLPSTCADGGPDGGCEG